MKKIFFALDIIRIAMVFTIICFAIAVNAQSVAINTTGNAADNSAMLDISSLNKGFLAPRMTTTQRTTIASPANGLLVFDTDTRSFWFYSSMAANWVQLSTGGGGGGGFALPYAGVYSDPGKIFSINNPDSSNGAAAIYGKSGNTGVGITPGINMGVWGDNSRGIGILGTSINGVGAYGLSFQNHGMSGYTTNNSYAGVYGSHANSGPGVFGEANSGGIGLYGRTTNTTGKAAFFENNNASGTDTVVKVLNNGLGVTSYFTNPNTSNTGALIAGDHYGKGSGIYMKLWNAQNNFPGFYMYQYGNGDGLYVGSNKSKVARFYANGNNADTALTVIHDGTGTGFQINLTSGLNTKNAVDVNTEGTGNAAKFVINNSSNSSAAVTVNTDGTGRGMQSTISNSANLAAAVYGSSAGNKGVEGIAQNYGVLGQSTGLTGGVGVFGQSALNSSDGIGVKGISYSNVTTSGAVTAINNGDGVGLFASSSGTNGNGIGVSASANAENGKGVYATGGFMGVHAKSTATNNIIGFGVVGETGTFGGIGTAGKFISNNSNDPMCTIEALNFGNGAGLIVAMNNSSNNATAVQVNQGGTGKLMSLWGQNNSDFEVSNNGNLTTTGTVTVKNNNGIVRNSSSTQLRVETLITPSGAVSNMTVNGGTFITVPITFSTAFSSAPVVYIANVSNQNLAAKYFLATVSDVTTTGCNLILTNTTGTVVVSGRWHLVAMGAE